MISPLAMSLNAQCLTRYASVLGVQRSSFCLSANRGL
jgi:hypothetical protein